MTRMQRVVLRLLAAAVVLVEVLLVPALTASGQQIASLHINPA